MPMKLYANPNSYLTHKVLVASAYAGIDVAPQKQDESGGRIPVLETEQGCLFSTNAIARYVSRLRRDLGLYGHNLYEAGSIDSWVDFCIHELEVPLGAWFQQANLPPAVVERAKGDVQKALTVIDNHLLHFTYMAGEHITLADISVVCVLHHGMSQVLTPDFLKPFNNLRRWFNLCTAQPEFSKVLGKAPTCANASAPKKEGQPPKKEAKQAEPAAKKEAAPKKEAAKKEAAPKKDAAPKKEGKKDNKKADAGKAGEEKAPPTAEELAAERKKKEKKVIKEGGKRGVEIEGAADMGGLEFFCTSVDEPEGDLELLEMCMTAMNAQSDPTEEERKGGSGKIGKMIFSAGTEQLSIVAYVPKEKKGACDAREWVKKVVDLNGGEVVKGGTDLLAKGLVKADGDKNKFPLKMKEPSITEAIAFLKAKGLFPDKDDSDDEFVFGDDDFPS